MHTHLIHDYHEGPEDTGFPERLSTMPAPKKAAKAVQKHEPDHKQPKHKAKKHDVAEPKHKQLKDLRRAYEHLGRAEALLSLLPPAVKTDVTTLIKLGQACLNDGHVKDTAHLLRASEHLAFASAVKAANRKNSVAAAVKHAVELCHCCGPSTVNGLSLL